MAITKTLSVKQGGIKMSKFTFESQGTNTYLVYTVSDEDVLDTMSLGMLTNNKIPGLATTLFTQMDATKYIKYNVSAKVSVRQFFSGTVNKKRLLGVFRGVVNALLSVGDYMIDENTIILDLDYVFADVSSCDTVLICLPVIGKEQSHNLGDFFKSIMFSTQFDQTENCDHVAKIINFLNSTSTFSLENFKNLLFEIDEAASVKQEQVSRMATQPNQNVAQNVAQKNEIPARPVISTKLDTNNIPAGIRTPQAQQSVNPTVAVSQQQSKDNIHIPPSTTPPASKPKSETGTEKKISMFGLLMHYSKENAELYKAQKAAKKGKQDSSDTNAQKTVHATAAVPGAPTKKQEFAIPGQPDQPPVSIPTQPPQALQKNRDHAIPASQPRVQIPIQKPDQQPQQLQQSKQRSQQAAQQFSIPLLPIQDRSADFGETVILTGNDEIGETMILGVDSSEIQIHPQLIRAKNNERINLNKPVFRIGKEKSYVDYCVSDNKAVSRSHANIIKRGDRFFIVDTNSTNHTYVNGGMIQSNVEIPLSHETKIQLANEEFEFRLY